MLSLGDFRYALRLMLKGMSSNGVVLSGYEIGLRRALGASEPGSVLRFA